VEAPHEKLAVVSVMAVNVRLVGTVGADRSPLPAELAESLKSSTATNASAALPTISEKRRVLSDLTHVDYCYSQVSSLRFYDAREGVMRRLRRLQGDAQ